MKDNGGSINQLHMVQEISQLVLSCSNTPLKVLLQRIAETGCQIFRFNSAVVSLLNSEKNTYTPRVVTGSTHFSPNSNVAEVTGEVVKRIFADRYRVKVIYYEQSPQDSAVYFNPQDIERRTQKRRPSGEWHERDVLLCRLLDSNGETGGYISFLHPADDCRLSRDLFYNLEIFSRCASSAVEYHTMFSNLRKNERHLKQLLVSSNIFRLQLDLDELFNEIVWAVNFSSSFNVVALGLVNKKSRSMDIRAAACTDKVKLNQIRELQFPLASIMPLFRDEYSRGKAFYINKPENVLERFREIYYGMSSMTGAAHEPNCKTLLIQIKSQNNNLYGLLLADDYGNLTNVSDEEIRILEIFANNIAIAIDNRNIYVQLRKKILKLEDEIAQYEPDFKENPNLAIKKMVDRIFKDFKRSV